MGDNDYRILFEDKRLDEDLERIVNSTAISSFDDYRIDELLGKVHNRLYILGAQPGTGKSTLFLQWADEFAVKGHPVLFANLEMPRIELIKKSISRLSEGTLALEDFDYCKEARLLKLAESYRETIAKNIMFIDKPVTPLELSHYVANVWMERSEPPIVFVDYIQIMPSDSNRKYTEERSVIKETVSALRSIANAHNCPVFAISSIRRTDYPKATAGLDALAEAQALEYGADVVAFLTNPKDAELSCWAGQKKRPVTLTVAKNRYGKTGSVDLRFDEKFAAFEVS